MPNKQETTAIPTAPVEKDPLTSFPIVGIGASAGGLEAFEQFLRCVPPDSGMAFVLVSHLDPNHNSLLTEILQRTTAMSVVEAQDHMTVAPNVIYVLPPKRYITISHGALQLAPLDQPRGLRMPIDKFMHSLADDQGENAIGIILSGTGTDGTLGLGAIRDAGGVTLVQDPVTAKFDGMPVSAIQAGNATHILLVEKMPEALKAQRTTLTDPQEKLVSTPGMAEVINVLRSATGHDFSLYKINTIRRRIERRMTQHLMDTPEIYARYLKEHPEEVQLLLKELLIKVTCFFRDREAFVCLKQDILPTLFKGKPEGYVFRVWVTGCATGQETYSIAILLREFLDETRQDFKVQFYSTDLDEDAIAAARAGIYPQSIADDVTPERLRRFFVKEEAGYRIQKGIREMVVFATHNVIKDPPFSNLDLLSCRNVMIYLKPELQNHVIPVFHYAIKPGGVLFLSPSECISGHPELFTPLNRKWKFYRATGAVTSLVEESPRALLWARDINTKESAQVTKKMKEPNYSELMKQALLKTYAPASVITDLAGNIFFVHGDTGNYLRQPSGEPSHNIVEMASDDLQQELRTVLKSASQGQSIFSREVSVKSPGHTQILNVKVNSLPARDGDDRLLLVSFEEITPSPRGKPARGKKLAPGHDELQRFDELQHELANSKMNHQATLEDQQASKEEFKSTNEELQSTNEELQSTIEELETSREELQSVNEELITVNSELQVKIEQLFSIQNDMKNLIDNISGGTIFLDRDFKIKRFTRETAQVYRLVATDVGRPLSDIKSDFVNHDLLADAHAVLESLNHQEHEVQTATGVWYLARIQPYRTLQNVIEGVAITLTDITQRVHAEAGEKLALKLAEGIVDTVLEPLIVLDENLKVISASRSFYRDFQTTLEDTVGRPIYSLGNQQWDIPKLRELLENILPHNQCFDGYEVEHDFPSIGHQRMRLNARRIVDSTGDTKMILLAMEKIM